MVKNNDYIRMSDGKMQFFTYRLFKLQSTSPFQKFFGT